MGACIKFCYPCMIILDARLIFIKRSLLIPPSACDVGGIRRRVVRNPSRMENHTKCNTHTNIHSNYSFARARLLVMFKIWTCSYKSLNIFKNSFIWSKVKLISPRRSSGSPGAMSGAILDIESSITTLIWAYKGHVNKKWYGSSIPNPHLHVSVVTYPVFLLTLSWLLPEWLPPHVVTYPVFLLALWWLFSEWFPRMWSRFLPWLAPIRVLILPQCRRNWSKTELR